MEVPNSFELQQINNTDHYDQDIDDAEYNADNFDLHKHRTTSLHRNLQSSREMSNREINVGRRGSRHLQQKNWMHSAALLDRQPLDEHVSKIVNKIEEEQSLMANNQEAEQLRRSALRDMPQSLAMKRLVKDKLLRSMNQSKRKQTEGIHKRAFYQLSFYASKAQTEINNLFYVFELWYLSLKNVEGEFGSAVGTFFRYFRWTFLLNILTLLLVTMFIVTPQIIYTTSATNETISINVIDKQLKEVDFNFVDIFTGEGFFMNTLLFYGYYTNETISLNKGIEYVMPHGYFFTMLMVFIINFIILSLNMALSYRKNFIETKSGLKNQFANKIFASWDFGIATKDSAKLKLTSIYNELKELINEQNSKNYKSSFMDKLRNFLIQFFANVLILIIISALGYGMWTMLDNKIIDLDEKGENNSGIFIALIVNVIIYIVPLFFDFIIRYEDYKNPRLALFITLARTFLLEVVAIGVLVIFWIIDTKIECWETKLGQEFYRLIIFDFLFSIIFLMLVTIIKNLIHKKWPAIRAPEFDIPRYTLQLNYNQTLFWMGLYFSPILSLIIIIKLFISWYMITGIILKFCVPSLKFWRSAQLHTWLFILTFLRLILVMAILGYIMVKIPTSSQCGPFRHLTYVYDFVKSGILSMEQGHLFWKWLLYLVKPGVVALIFLAMCMTIYYLKAKANAQDDIVANLRNLLVFEARDKEYLLKRIAKFTKGQSIYNGQNNSLEALDPYKTAPANYNIINRNVVNMDYVENVSSSEILLPSETGDDGHVQEDISVDPVFERYKKYN